MKKSIWVFTACCSAAAVYLVICTATFDTTHKNYPPADSCFLATHWKQMGGFEKYTPDHMRLGCWSTALAQIVYFHRLKPFGHIAYRSRRGYNINEDIDSNAIHFSQMANQIDSTSSQTAINAMALYNYDAALAVNKDFGTDNYMHKLAPSSLFETHYHVKVSRYVSWQQIFPYTPGKQEEIIRREIHAKRPLFLHFANLKDFGHSVVIDGYKMNDGHFYVHLNQGQGGPQDGWYDFEKDLLKQNDTKLRVIYTFCTY